MFDQPDNTHRIFFLFTSTPVEFIEHASQQCIAIEKGTCHPGLDPEAPGYGAFGHTECEMSRCVHGSTAIYR